MDENLELDAQALVEIRNAVMIKYGLSAQDAKKIEHLIQWMIGQGVSNRLTLLNRMLAVHGGPVDRLQRGGDATFEGTPV